MGRLTLLMIGAVFLLPIVAAYLYRPSGETGNHGTLIQPPRPLESFRMIDLDGSAAGLDTLRGKWTVLYVGGEQCGEQCRRGLYNIERVRLAQGKNMRRVQSFYLAPKTMESREIAETLVEYTDVRGYRISRRELGSMAPDFDWNESGDPGPRERTYIIDPLGNLMMYYSRDVDPSGMKSDLERLLKVSQVG